MYAHGPQGSGSVSLPLLACKRCWGGQIPRGGTRPPANQPQLALGMHGPSQTQVLLSPSSLAVPTTIWAATEWEALGQTLLLSYTCLLDETNTRLYVLT